MERNQYEIPGSQIEVTGHEDRTEGDVTVRELFGRIARTGGESDFLVQITGLPDAVEEFTAGLLFSRLELQRIEDPQAWRDAAQQSALDERRAAWNDLLEKARQFVADAGLDELSDPLLLCRFSPEGKQPLLEAVDFNPRLDFHVELRADSELNPDIAYALSIHVAHTHSPVSIARGQTHFYSYSYGRPNAASASMGVPDGDADLFLYRGGSRLAFSINGARQSEHVYASGGAGSWQVRVYGYTDAYYELDASWV